MTQVIHNDLKPFGATINNATQTLWFGNTTDSTVTAIDAKTGAVKGRLVLDNRQRSETVRPLAPRELAVNEKTNTVYITGLGKESVIWVVDSLGSAKEIYEHLVAYNEAHRGSVDAELLDIVKKDMNFERLYGNHKDSTIKAIKDYFTQCEENERI